MIRRLTSTDKWAGFGALAAAEQDTRRGMERIREELRDGMRRDVEEN